ncbi:MAG: CapA family protein, partial [Sandaracinaceae bacterium]
MRRAVVRTAYIAALLSVALAASFGRAQPAATRRVVIGGSGDVLFHTRVVAAAAANGGFDHVFSGLRTVISEDEIAFANLETPLSTDHAPMRGDPPRLGAPPAAAAALNRAGIDVLSLANNHAWDQRVEGMVDTIAALDGSHIAHVGVGPDEDEAPGPVIIERTGVRVAFVAFTVILQGSPGTRRPAVRVSMWDERRARRVLGEAREQADLVVASMHWGIGYRHDDRSEQRTRAAFLVEHGADLVLGHGPHVLQR